MRFTRLLIAALLAVAVFGVTSAFASSKLKYGYYYDIPHAVSMNVSKDRTTVSQLSFTCVAPGQEQIGYIFKKHPKFSGGKFALKTTAKLTAFGKTTIVKLTVDAKLSTTGKIKGTITQTSTPAFCAPVAFSAKYIGTTPLRG